MISGLQIFLNILNKKGRDSRNSVCVFDWVCKGLQEFPKWSDTLGKRSLKRAYLHLYFSRVGRKRSSCQTKWSCCKDKQQGFVFQALETNGVHSSIYDYKNSAFELSRETRARYGQKKQR